MIDFMPRRRAFFAVAVAALLAGCATSPPLPPEAAGVPIAAIRVTGNSNPWVQELAPRVSQDLASLLGPRYQPGARNGATLAVDLNDVGLPNDDPETSGPDTDYLGGNVSLTRGRSAIANFPFSSNSITIYSSPLDLVPDPQRLDALARTFSYFLVQKLG